MSIRKPLDIFWFLPTHGDGRYLGSSNRAHDIAARHVKLYLSWGEPPSEVARKFADVRRRAGKEGRQVRLGMRLHVIPRETEAAAWQAAEELS
ncbi:LLM class flavin-dependent oxidoreductase [Thauera butanivorans]|uniref:LLM class flavin-dependent oxidoreductase n=1 Tax=Thauera butanivorans TaxID=86174 RepID=UPI0008394173|nr:LLM class flavin-dependent oxidoreductase [Thauera butanivorans]